MRWREYILSPTGEASFSPPIDQDEIENAERALRTSLPKALTALLMETDGVQENMD